MMIQIKLDLWENSGTSWTARLVTTDRVPIKALKSTTQTGPHNNQTPGSQRWRRVAGGLRVKGYTNKTEWTPI